MSRQINITIYTGIYGIRQWTINGFYTNADKQYNPFYWSAPHNQDFIKVPTVFNQKMKGFINTLGTNQILNSKQCPPSSKFTSLYTEFNLLIYVLFSQEFSVLSFYLSEINGILERKFNNKITQNLRTST